MDEEAKGAATLIMGHPQKKSGRKSIAEPGLGKVFNCRWHSAGNSPLLLLLTRDSQYTKIKKYLYYVTSGVKVGISEKRFKIIKNAKRVIVKVGSAVLTNDRGLDHRIIWRLTDQLAALHDRGLDLILVSSGAVAAGHPVITGEIKELRQKQAVAAVGQSRLMHAYDAAFSKLGKTTAQVLLTRDDLQNRRRFHHALATFQTLFGWRVIPVVNQNDTVAVDELEFGDNDALASLILNLVGADLLINLTSADGVYDANPATEPAAQKLEVIENICSWDIDGACAGKTAQGTGGMHSKLVAARRAAQRGVPTLILSGKELFGLRRIFEGENLGTWVVPDEKAISRRKFWLAYNKSPAGTLVVDDGAATALERRGKSLLPAGIKEVQGHFEAGELVLVADSQGEVLGVGLCQYNASDLKKIMGRQSSDIGKILGCNPPSYVIHRDDLLLGAAV